MSFRCPKCQNAFEAPARPIRVVTAFRSHTHEDGRVEKQISHELTTCVNCAYKIQPEDPEVLRRLTAEERKNRRDPADVTA